MSRIFALIPAGGSGSRLAGEMPKQYLELAGKPMLYHAMQTLCANPSVERVFVVLAPDDTWFSTFNWKPHMPRISALYCGGETRAASVFNGLVAVRDAIAGSDWMLVHDAARPCLAANVLERLISALRDESTGGLLALPVVDTVKRSDSDSYVLQTERREYLWQAQTPQMFRYGLLIEALRAIDPATVSDESRAIEQLGLRPKLVHGDSRNIKVTYPDDLALAELILKSMGTPMDADARR